MDEQRGIQCASNPLGVRQGPKAFLQTTLMKKHPVLKHYISFAQFIALCSGVKT